MSHPFEDFPPGFSFVDAHHHLWDLTRHGYSWLKEHRDMTRFLGDYSAICADYSIASYKRDALECGLTKSVHIETADAPDPVMETQWLQAISDSDPDGFPHAIVGAADLTAPDVADCLDRHMSFRNFRGIRMLSFRNESFIEKPSFLNGLRQLAVRRLSFDLDVDWPLTRRMLIVLDQVPDLSIVLGHCAFPKARNVEYFSHWRAAMKMMAERPNIACKISGLGMIDHHWSVNSIRPWVSTSIDLFGTERSMFATNWPVDSLYSTYRQLITAYISIVGKNSGDLSRLFRHNAERVYRI